MGNTEVIEQRRFERRALVTVSLVAVLIVGGFVHAVNWGGYAFEVLPLQAAGFLGLESNAGLKRMAEICLEIKRLDCVEHSYQRLSAVEPDGILRLGRFQFNRMKYAEAAGSFRQFFARGGQNLDAAYFYARALGETGHIEDSSKYFDYVIAAKPDILQVTVAQNYVRLLVTHGRLDQALKVIDSIRHRGANAAGFMDSEYKVIQEKALHRPS